MVELLPNYANNIKSLTDPEILYILSVYYLEHLRSAAGTFRTVFVYLEDPTAMNSDLIALLKGIAEKVKPFFFFLF